MLKNDLVESIKCNMPEGLTQLEIARYIYIQLGKQRRFDIKFYYGNSATRHKIQRLAMLSRLNAKSLYNEKNLVCISISYLYRSILKEYGIDCMVVKDDIYNNGHTMTVLTLDDEKKGHLRIRADLQRDLPWIQAGMETFYFGDGYILDSECTELSNENLKEIDRKIGYITDDYKNKELYELAKEVAGMDVKDGLKYVLNDSRITEGTNFQGHVEAREYYGSILNTLLKKYMRKKAFIFSCYRDNDDNQDDSNPRREYTMCVFSYDKNECNPYLYSTKEKRFLPVSIDKLIELQKEGLVLGTSPKANGAGLLKRLLKTRKEERSKDCKTDER